MKEGLVMSLVRWLANFIVRILAAFKNSLTHDRVGPGVKSIEEAQERERQTHVRELNRLKNIPPES